MNLKVMKTVRSMDLTMEIMASNIKFYASASTGMWD
jgi:hypothetical protein